MKGVLDMLSKIKNYFSDVKHIIDIIIIILTFNTIVNLFCGTGILPTIIPLLYFCIIRFSKRLNLSMWNIIFLIWNGLNILLVFLTPSLVGTSIELILLFIYLLFVNYGNKLNILNKKNLLIVCCIVIVGLIIGCAININYFLTTEFGFSGTSFALFKIGLLNTMKAVIILNVISVLLVFLYQLLVIIYFNQYANYKIRSKK